MIDLPLNIQAIVSIMGPYRTGKSFLLDRLVPHDDGVFPFKVIGISCSSIPFESKISET